MEVLLHISMIHYVLPFIHFCDLLILMRVGGWGARDYPSAHRVKGVAPGAGHQSIKCMSLDCGRKLAYQYLILNRALFAKSVEEEAVLFQRCIRYRQCWLNYILKEIKAE